MIKKSNLCYTLFLLVCFSSGAKAQLYGDVNDVNGQTNIGIGIPYPTKDLHIYHSSTSDIDIRLQNSQATYDISNAGGYFDIDYTVPFLGATLSGNAISIGRFSSDYFVTIDMKQRAKFSARADFMSNVICNGNVGIGTSLPTEALHLNNGFAKANGYLVTGSSTDISDWNAPWYGLSLVQEADLDLDTDNSNSHPIVLQSYYGMAFRTSSGFMAMDNHGIVSIGLDGSEMSSLAQNTTANNPYKLYVADGIRTEEVLIDIKNGNWWPDYVFEDTYHLLALSEVEAFIQKYKHLPNVPSAKTVEENGVQIGEMNATLLRKVEELTLYVIELEKKVKALEQKK
jgi:hypothetical protein